MARLENLFGYGGDPDALLEIDSGVDDALDAYTSLLTPLLNAFWGIQDSIDPFPPEFSSLTSGSFDGDGGTVNFSTASVTPTTNRLQLLALTLVNNTTTPTAPTTVIGNGLTWVLVDTVVINDTASIRGVCFLYRAMATSATLTGATTFTSSFTIPNNCAASWSWMEVDHVPTTGNGATAVVQVVKTERIGTGVTALVATLATFNSTKNRPYAFVGGFDGGAASFTLTPANGYTQDSTAIGTVARKIRLFTFHAPTSAAGASFTASNSAMYYCVLAIEVQSGNSLVPNTWDNGSWDNSAWQ